MGKSSNMRKSVRQPAGLVNVFSKGGITVRATHAFPPELAPLVVFAFRHFINDRIEEGMKLVAELQFNGCDFFDFTMASTTNPQLGDSCPLIWAWGAASRSSLLWLTAECLRKGRFDQRFFVILPQQLELAEEGSDQCRLGVEVFTKLARYLVSEGVESEYVDMLDAHAPRASAIFKGLLAERFAAKEHATLSENTSLASHPEPSQITPTRRL